VSDNCNKRNRGTVSALQILFFRLCSLQKSLYPIPIDTLMNSQIIHKCMVLCDGASCKLISRYWEAPWNGSCSVWLLCLVAVDLANGALALVLDVTNIHRHYGQILKCSLNYPHVSLPGSTLRGSRCWQYTRSIRQSVRTRCFKCVFVGVDPIIRVLA
jgi:hypothetical protein